MADVRAPFADRHAGEAERRDLLAFAERCLNQGADPADLDRIWDEARPKAQPEPEPKKKAKKDK